MSVPSTNSNVPQPETTALQEGHQHRHTSVVEKLAWFEYQHLGHPDIKRLVEMFNRFTDEVLQLAVKDNPQLTIGLQHLIEAKDAIARSLAR